MTLTKEEMDAIQRDAEELYPGWEGGGSFTHKANHIASLQQEAHCRCAAKYEAQLKQERERAGKLMDALEEIRDNQFGISWVHQIARIAITKYKK